MATALTFLFNSFITDTHDKDLKGARQQKKDYESVYSPTYLQPKTCKRPTDYENVNKNQIAKISSKDLQPQTSGAYESVISSDHSHVYGSLRKSGNEL